MGIPAQVDSIEAFYATECSLVRFIYLAADNTKPNELWFIGSAIEFQEKISADPYKEVYFDLGDEIEFRQSVMKVVAIEAAPLPTCPSLPAEEKVVTYYIASSAFPLM